MSVYINAGDYRSGPAIADMSVPVVLATDHDPIATVPGQLDLLELPFTFNTSGNKTIIPAVVGAYFQVMKLFLATKGKISIDIRDGLVTSIFGAPLDFDKGSLILDNDSAPWATTSVDNPLVFNYSTNIQAHGRVYYLQVGP